MTKIDPAQKYAAFPMIDLPHRQWPSQQITEAPEWCSVDLRDGNQALIEPMGHDRKMRMFDLLLKMGFKEIEVGFPAASQTDYDFTRFVIDENRLPADVAIQVLTQAREDLIRKTFEAIKGAPKAIIHLYNSTSVLQRKVVFGMDQQGIIDIAVKGAKLIKDLADQTPETEIIYQYSPESFTGTELDFAVEICEAVMDVFEPTVEKPLIVNLPATVEMASPNFYADQIEWFCRHVKNRETLRISVHPHNDRGTAVAAAELALMAGADRIEGTLFGNGERTGNVDLVTLGLNMFTQGIDPALDFSDINEVARVYKYANQMEIHPRHPYAGELVFTAFSGSHQDAINKGLKAYRSSNSKQWEIPYLPIDPNDVGRSYEAVIRINSQSGKGGIAYVLETDYGIRMPRRMQIEFSKIVQDVSDREGVELRSERIWDLFQKEYLDQEGSLTFVRHTTIPDSASRDLYTLEAQMVRDGVESTIEGQGTGPIDGYTDALSKALGMAVDVVDYQEHSAGLGGAAAVAVSYVEIRVGEKTFFGVGRDKNIVAASLHAITSATNRALLQKS